MIANARLAVRESEALLARLGQDTHQFGAEIAAARRNVERAQDALRYAVEASDEVRRMP
jgi:hypothetical protein